MCHRQHQTAVQQLSSSVANSDTSARVFEQVCSRLCPAELLVTCASGGHGGEAIEQEQFGHNSHKEREAGPRDTGFYITAGYWLRPSWLPGTVQGMSCELFMGIISLDSPILQMGRWRHREGKLLMQDRTARVQQNWGIKHEFFAAHLCVLTLSAPACSLIHPTNTDGHCVCVPAPDPGDPAENRRDSIPHPPGAVLVGERVCK